MQLFIRAGSVFEYHKISGFAHFIEHLTFKSSIDFPNNNMVSTISFLGGYINAYTEYDTTCFYILLPREMIEQGLDVIANIAYKARFTDLDIEIERDIIIEEIKQYKNDPESAFLDWIQMTYFKRSNLKNPILGSVRSVKTANMRALTKFYRKFYSPNNSFLLISGDFDKRHVLNVCNHLFSDWSNLKPQLKKLVNVIPEQNGFRFFTKYDKLNGEFLAFVIPELSAKDRLNDTMMLIVKAFASGKRSRLHKRLIDKEKLVVAVHLYSIGGLLPGVTIIQIIPINSSLTTEIIYSFYDEWIRVKQDFFTNDELMLIKKEMLYSWLYEHEYIESLANAIGNEELVDNHHNYFLYPQKIKDIAETDFQECMEKFWRWDYLAIYYQGKNVFPKSIKQNLYKLFQDASLQTPKYRIKLSKFEYKPIIPSIQNNEKRQLRKTCIYKDIRLRNGTHLILRKVENKPLIGVAVTTACSQLTEDITEIGLNYLTSNLMLYGTESNSYEDIQYFLKENGLSIKVSQSLETTTFKGKCLSYAFEKLLKTLAELIYTPSLPSKYLMTLKSEISENLKREKRNPFVNAFDKWVYFFLGKETNLHKPYPDIIKLNAFKTKDILRWYLNYYQRQKYVISIVGDFDFNHAEDLVQKYFGEAVADSISINHNLMYKNSQCKVRYRKIDSDQSNIVIGGFGSPCTETQFNTGFYILAQILGGEISSRFFNILREKYGYTYQNGFDFTSIQSLGFWYAYAICDKSDYKEVYRLLSEIISDVCHNGVTEFELLSAKNYLKGMNRFDMESLSWQATTLSILYTLGYDYDYFMNRETRIDSINQDIIKSIASRWLSFDNIYAYIER